MGASAQGRMGGAMPQGNQPSFGQNFIGAMPQQQPNAQYVPGQQQPQRQWTDAQVKNWFNTVKPQGDQQIAQAMADFGVGADQISRVTGAQDAQQRFTNQMLSGNLTMPQGSQAQFGYGQTPFQQSSMANTQALQGTQAGMNYQPMNVQGQGYNPAMMQSTGYNASLAGSQGYTAERAVAERAAAERAASQGYGAQNVAGAKPINEMFVNAGQLSQTNLDPYMNPYTSAVTQQTLQDLERSRQMQQNQLGAQAQAAGAFGGSRQGVAEAETNRAFAEQAARTAGQLNQAGFTQAQQAAQQDIANAMQANLANQQANLAAQTTTGAQTLQAQLANQAAQNQASQFGAQAANTAALQNAQLGTNVNLQNAQLGTNVNLANQSAANQAAQFGAQAANVAALQNAAAQNAASQFGASAANQAAQLNQGAFNTAGQFGASAANQAALANQSAGLQGNQQRLAAAAQMGNLGNLGFGQGMQVQQANAQAGLQQQALQQALIDAAKGQYGGYTGAPQNTLAYLSQALGVTPQASSTTTNRNPGLFDYLTLGASMFG